MRYLNVIEFQFSNIRPSPPHLSVILGSLRKKPVNIDHRATSFTFGYVRSHPADFSSKFINLIFDCVLHAKETKKLN